MTNDDYDKIFTDLDAFGISLCHNGHDGNETCEVLDDQYTPVTNSEGQIDFGMFS